MVVGSISVWVAVAIATWLGTCHRYRERNQLANERGDGYYRVREREAHFVKTYPELGITLIFC